MTRIPYRITLMNAPGVHGMERAAIEIAFRNHLETLLGGTAGVLTARQHFLEVDEAWMRTMSSESASRPRTPLEEAEAAANAAAREVMPLPEGARVVVTYGDELDEMPAHGFPNGISAQSLAQAVNAGRA